MVTLDDIKALVNRINIATARRIDAGQAAIIHGDISRLNLGDQEFIKISTAYLDLEDIPKNITKFFKDEHYANMRRKQNEPPPKEFHDSVAGEYSGEHAGLFCRCTNLALRAYHKRRPDYDKWSVWFNAKWAGLKDAELTDFLVGEKARLGGGTKTITKGVLADAVHD